MTQSGHRPRTENRTPAAEIFCVLFCPAHLSENADSVKVLTMDEARRVASNIANCRHCCGESSAREAAP